MQHGVSCADDQNSLSGHRSELAMADPCLPRNDSQKVH